MPRGPTPSLFSLSVILLVALHDGRHSIRAFSPPSVRYHMRLPRTAPSQRGRFTVQHISMGDREGIVNVNATSTGIETANDPGSVDTFGMPDLTQMMVDEEEQTQVEAGAGQNLQFLGGAAALLLTLVVGANSFGSPSSLAGVVQSFLSDPSGTIQSALAGLNPTTAMVYFGVIYVVAELIAIPATPLTLTAGYLFGVANGTAVVLCAGVISAVIGFGIGRTILRQRVEGVLDDKPTFKKLDAAIGSEGLKLLVLVRLTPIFPFSLLNYFYGASSIPFPTFVGGTLLGFLPTTLIYVYTGLAGKELMVGGGSQPWYVYVGTVTILVGLLKVVTDVASDLIQAVDETK